MVESQWREKASCYGHPLALEGAWDFDKPKKRVKATAVCYSCPVRRECYDDAVADPSSEGIRGGVLFKIRPLTRVEKDPTYGVPEFNEEKVSELRHG